LKRLRLVLSGLVVATTALLLGHHAQAADHLDGPAASADPHADITDLFAWMSSDQSKLNLVMDVFPNASANSQFSNSVQYVFHMTANATFGGSSNPVDLICTFDTTQVISCWLGTQEYLHGDASTPSGITSADGRMRVFAGPRNDPFFFNIHGFHTAVATVRGAASSLTFDAGCPLLDSATSAALVSQLSHDDDGGAPHDNFAGMNVLSLAIQLDKTLVAVNGSPLVSVWASTNRSP